MGALRFLLGSEYPTMAFRAEKTTVVWPETPHVDGLGFGDTPDTVPASSAAIVADAVVVSAVQTAAVRFVPSDPAATYSFQLYGANLGDEAMDAIRLASDAGLSGRVRMKVDVQDLDYLFVQISALSAGTIDVEVALVEFFEDEEGS